VLKGIFTVSAAPSGQELEDIGDLVGVGSTIRKVQALVGKIARANTTVLITGESGTGKEIVARLIHRYSDRAKGPFVPVNCGRCRRPCWNRSCSATRRAPSLARWG
jgi:DNA-binding NtrC family response regulator